MNRPEWLTCVKRPKVDATTSWCGRDLDGFHFTGLDHAAGNVLAGGRLVACPACVRVAVRVLLLEDTEWPA